MAKAKAKVVLAPVELQPYEFQCKGCKKVHKRDLWSVAHYNVPHDFTCECGHVTKNVQKLGV